MENDSCYDFDLRSLLRLGSLEIRKIAKKNKPSIRIGEYYNFLSKFINQTATIMKTLKRISEQKIDDKDLRDLQEIRILLEDMGCYSFIPVIDELINVGKRGYNKSVADYAKDLINLLGGLHTQIMAAKKTEEPETAEKAQFSTETQLLSKVLNLLDHEEATRKLRILAVDDSPSMIKTISAALENDYKVYGMTNPAMLENFLQQITPDLFLLDYEMPELSGFDLVPIIRNSELHKDTPIIFLTHMGTIDHVSAAYALGASDLIVKPLQDTVLCEKFAKHKEKKKLF
jgi:CheY-like chemotaxis protein